MTMSIAATDPLPPSSIQTGTVHHNLSANYLTTALSPSAPLIDLHQTYPEVSVIYCAHNPKAQGMDLLRKDAPMEDVRHYVKECLIDPFVAMERTSMG
mmetsp:Transcript_5718/g.8515  ORF Transcript_5718/g.8515 Transcript_5718/m.8515 type:complete len:98 (-) Transcript_5718:225-518(-)